MNSSSSGAAPGTMTLNDYRVCGFVPEDTGNGPSTTALVLASALVVAVLAVDAYVFFGPWQSDKEAAAPTAAPTVGTPRADATAALPARAAPSESDSQPVLSSPVGTPPSLARAETSAATPAPAAAPSSRTAPERASVPKSSAPVATAKSAASRKGAATQTTRRSSGATGATDSNGNPRDSAVSPAPASDVTPPAAAAPAVAPNPPVASGLQDSTTSSN